MAELQLEFRQFLEEIKAMRRLADSGGFLASASIDRLQEFQEAVERVRGNGNRETSYTVGISKNFPVETRISRGDYQPNKSETRPVVGGLSTCWYIRPTGTRKSRRFKAFAVDTESGAVSTRACVRKAGENHLDCEELAVWHSDIRSLNGLGCYYHFQVLGDSAEPPFPDYLDIPRFPDPFMTPMAVLEFLLCELFPKAWVEHVTSEDADSVGEWRKIQKEKWITRFESQKKDIANTNSTPWVSARLWSPC